MKILHILKGRRMGRRIVLLVLASALSLVGRDLAPMEQKIENEVKATLPKHTLKSNYQVVYHKLPGTVDSFSDMFSEGMFYGRLRSNTFHFKWEAEKATQNSHISSGLGGSLIFKSANYTNFDFTLGGYYSRGFFDSSQDPVESLKAGKDVISRFDYTNTGSKNLAVLGQAYVRYTGIDKTTIKIGRQIVESFYAKSNDTKMIPNTFDGVVIDTKALSNTTIHLGYLYEQKLRDHSTSHSVLAVGDANSTTSNNPQWSENDDTAMHKGLTYSRLQAAGVDTNAPLILGDIQNKSIANLKLNASFYTVPKLLSSVMAEANYKIQMNGFSITPGVRYLKQFDNGAGTIGGAAYRGQLAGETGAFGGYKDASSLDSQMIAARVITKIKKYKINLGYSYIFDEADLIAPWRAFPTSGYTRSMARYNWMANTKSYRLEVVRNGNSKGIYKNLYTQMSVLYTDADETKGYYDEMYYYAGFVKNFPSLDNMQARFRIGYQDTDKIDASGLDTRFEINYQF